MVPLFSEHGKGLLMVDTRFLLDGENLRGGKRFLDRGETIIIIGELCHIGSLKSPILARSYVTLLSSRESFSQI
jgi:hypothetical protein